MAYTRTTWINGETSLSADHLNNIEDGIQEAITPATQTKKGAMSAADKVRLDTVETVVYQQGPVATQNAKGYMSAADKTKLDNIIDIIYPVGSIYMSVNTTSPATLFGGTWQKLEGRFLLGASSNYTSGSTGGSADAVVPYHNHTVASSGGEAGAITGGSHKHNLTERNNTGTSTTFALETIEAVAAQSGNRIASSTHTHDLPDHTHTVNYAGTSGNATGANMPPYLVVNIWKRTA